MLFDNKLELYIKNDEVTIEKIKEKIIDGCWTNEEEMQIEGNTIKFTGGEYDNDFEITLNKEQIDIEGDNGWEVVQIWEQLKSVAL